METYHEAGVQGGLVEELPIKLAVADRNVALLAMTDPILPEVGFPTVLFVEHPGFAWLQAEAFERQWDNAELLGGPARAQNAPRSKPRVRGESPEMKVAEDDAS